MKKGPIALLLVAVMLVGMIPFSVFATGGNTSTATVDTSWYDATAASGTVFEIADAADLMGAAKLSQNGATFSGYTLKLTNNIDLNPGWNADVTISGGKATLPDAPTTEFPGFAIFSGILDGNEKTLSGIYMCQKLLVSSDNLGVIEILNGTVKNLIINNSFIFAEPKDGVTDCKIGGIAARIKSEAAHIDTVYADINVWYRSWTWERIAGIVAKTEVACTIQNVAFVGTVGNMTPGNSVPSTSTGVYISQLVADGNWKTGLQLINCSLKGTEYANKTTGAIIGSNDSCGTKTNILIGTDATLPNAVSAMNPTSYTCNLEAFNIWPDGVTADSNTMSYDDGKQAYVKYYERTTSARYTAYLTKLADNGYIQEATYTVGDNSYALYQKAGAYSVYVSYLAKVDGYGYARMRVFVEVFGSAYNLNVSATTSNVCTSQIWQLDVDNSYSNEDGGMSYVIRLTDGAFIVVDGGYESETEADNLYNILFNNNPNSGNPVIRAWFITHLHSDHFGALVCFANKYGSNVTVEGFYYNFPGNNVSGEDSTDTVSVNSIKTAEMAMNMFDGAVRYRKIHSGMTFGFAGVTATVLGTHEDVKQSYYRSPDSIGDYFTGYSFKRNNFKDGNDTSTVVKFTVGTQTFMILADARTGMSKQLEYSYTDRVLECDIVQMAHHGFTGCQDSLYEKISPTVVLWPMDIISYSGISYSALFKNYYSSTDISANQYVRETSSILEVIPAYENVCLNMPYTANTYSGTGNKTVDLDDALTEKLNIINGAGADTFWYDANTDAAILHGIHNNERKRI